MLIDILKIPNELKHIGNKTSVIYESMTYIKEESSDNKYPLEYMVIKDDEIRRITRKRYIDYIKRHKPISIIHQDILTVIINGYTIKVLKDKETNIHTTVYSYRKDLSLQKYNKLMEGYVCN